jgi:hypothetical protein
MKWTSRYLFPERAITYSVVRGNVVYLRGCTLTLLLLLLIFIVLIICLLFCNLSLVNLFLDTLLLII